MESLEAVSLARRLDHLERAHRRLKRAVAGGLIALAAVGVMGQAAVTRLKTVEAETLVLRDAAQERPGDIRLDRLASRHLECRAPSILGGAQP